MSILDVSINVIGDVVLRRLLLVLNQNRLVFLIAWSVCKSSFGIVPRLAGEEYEHLRKFSPDVGAEGVVCIHQSLVLPARDQNQWVFLSISRVGFINEFDAEDVAVPL